MLREMIVHIVNRLVQNKMKNCFKKTFCSACVAVWFVSKRILRTNDGQPWQNICMWAWVRGARKGGVVQLCKDINATYAFYFKAHECQHLMYSFSTYVVIQFTIIVKKYNPSK